MEEPLHQKSKSHREDCSQPPASTISKAENGEADAQFDLAVMLACGEGESRDYGRAMHWYTKAADQDHAMAQLNLGMMYAEGQGVDPDDALATVWIRKSAEQGDAGAQFNLGVRCGQSSLSESECDAAESRIESYKWLQLAASQGYHPASASKEQVALRMSPADVSQGDDRAASFLADRQEPASR